MLFGHIKKFPPHQDLNLVDLKRAVAMPNDYGIKRTLISAHDRAHSDRVLKILAVKK